jgi:hypothetical protein
MDNRSLEQLLNQYDQSFAEDGVPADVLAGLPDEARAELESLAQLNLLLKRTVLPLSPRLAFREDLRQSLLTSAMARRGWRGVVLVQLREHWKFTAAAATASGVSVAVGAIGVVAWYRGRS